MNSPRYLTTEDAQHRPVCPQCGGPLRRVHRHAIDMLIDTLIPVLRFRCVTAECGWEGRRRRLQTQRSDGARRQVL
ncbi:hypothetical protein [Roseateles microcysteis]|uniref:hypothetical protein n=1 Tax=Roseateles microcysteis TaxID=3119057 RepID=UPI002FE5D492